MGQSLSLALFQAASSGDAQRIKLLVNQGADVHATDDENGWTALHYATWAGQVSCVRELLVGGGEVDARDNELKTPLHYAVLGGHEAIMQSLLNHGAQVNAADISGQTALHKASAQGQLRFVQELIEQGADVNARLQDGSSAIHLASWKGHTSVLEYLLQHGGNVDSLNSNGEAALHEAARYGNEDCCRLLMRRGASTSVLNHEGQTPADVAEQSSHLRTASLVSPDPKQVAKQKQIQELQRRQNTPSAQPSAPTAPYFTDTERVTYPVINPPTQTETPGLGFHKREEGNTSSKNGPATQRSRRYGLPEEDDSDDWEPRTSEDWEGIEAPNNVESQGGRLMNRFEQEDDTSGQTQDPFWMIPGPIKWAAGSIGGVLNNVNPFKSPRANPPESQTQEVPKSPEALESALEDKKAEVSKLKSSEKTQELTDFQLKRLKDQEAEIAALKKQLDESKSEPQASSSKIPENSKSAKSRHHIIDLPPASQSTARLLSRENLQRATNGFSYKISETPEGTFYRGKLDNANMLVSVPKDRGFLPNESVKQAANKLANLAANPFGSQLLSLRAYSEDGCAVYELLENGTVEDSLRSRIPVPGKQPHRLDWNSRAKVALTTAQGLLGLRQEGLQHRPAALLPNKVYLGSLGQAKILPPSISSLVTGQETVASQISYIAPEVREGGNQSVKSDVFSLGVFLLQLLTGSEASGLIQYVDSALKSGKLETILDPCAEGISVPSAISLAKLALRCAEFHPEARPDLENEILPQLHNLVGTVENGLSAPSEEPPEHLVCPITQEVMEKPVILADGYTYEESAIRKWLSTGKQVSPMTNQQLENLTLTPNYVIKSAASTWREKHPENLSSTSTYSQKPAQNPANPRLKQEVDEMNQILSQNEENLQSNPGVQSQVSDESVITDSDLPSPPNHAYWASSNEESIPQRQYAS